MHWAQETTQVYALKSTPSDASQRIDTDLALAERCRSDVRARAALFRQHAPTVFRLACRVMRDETEAEDMLQETFIRAFDSIHRYRGEAPLSSWLHRIAVRTCWQHLERRGRRKRLSLRMVEEASGDPAWKNEATQVDSRAALRRLSELLEKLNPRRRMVFVLHHVEGFPIRDAAALMGISNTAGKKLVVRARHDLCRLAKDEPVLAALFKRDGQDGAHSKL